MAVEVIVFDSNGVPQGSFSLPPGGGEFEMQPGFVVLPVVTGESTDISFDTSADGQGLMISVAGSPPLVINGFFANPNLLVQMASGPVLFGASDLAAGITVNLPPTGGLDPVDPNLSPEVAAILEGTLGAALSAILSATPVSSSSNQNNGPNGPNPPSGTKRPRNADVRRRVDRR